MKWCSPHAYLIAELLEQRLCLLQVGGIKAFGEPAVDLGEHRVRFVAATLLAKQPREARGRAQLPRFGALLACNLNRALKAALCFRRTGIVPWPRVTGIELKSLCHQRLRDCGVDEISAVISGQPSLISRPMKLHPEDGENLEHQRPRQARGERSVAGRYSTLSHQL